MSRKPTFSIRSLMVLAVLVAVASLIFTLASRRAPRTFKPLDRFTAFNLANGWSIEVAPDIKGPYRVAGDETSIAATCLCNTGQSAKGWVKFGTRRRTFNHPGRPGIKYLVKCLENREGELTFLILSKPNMGGAGVSGAD